MTLITPYFPGVLQSLDEEGSQTQTQSLLHINGDKRIQDIFELIDSSLKSIAGINFQNETTCENERTIQYLGCRIFNSSVSAVKLAVCGFYQSGFSQIRDLVETGFLLDYFSHEPSKVEIWRNSTHEVRRKQFAPKKVREDLDKRDGFKERKRDRIYQALCEFATHPTYSGFSLIAQNGFVKIGPFFDPRLLERFSEEMVLRLPVAVLYFLESQKQLPESTLELRHEFLCKLGIFNNVHLGMQRNSNVQDLGDLMKNAITKKYL